MGEYEGNEACFYKTMDWVKGNEVQPSVIEAHMAGLQNFDSFKDNINACSTWSGNFGGRKKRAVGDASEDTIEVPSVMESGSGALQWVRSLVRRARNAEPGNEKCKVGKNCRKGKAGTKGKAGGRGKAGRNGDKCPAGKKGKACRKRKKNKQDGRKKGRNDGGSNEKNRSDKSSDLLPDFVYNKLWCFDLAMEQALQKCVEDKLNN